MALVVESILALEDQDAIEVFSRANPGWKIEFNESGSLVVSPTSSDGGARDAETVGQLREFATLVGGKAFGSSTGFRIPGGGLRSPDTSWIRAEHLARLTPDDKQKFWKTCPDVVVELLSDTDSRNELQAKITLFYESGARYAVGIDPSRRDLFLLGTPPARLQLDFDAIIDA